MHLRAKWATGIILLVPLATMIMINMSSEQDFDWNSDLLSQGITVVLLTSLLAWAYLRRIKKWSRTVERYEVRIKEGEYVSVTNPKEEAAKDSSVIEDVSGLNWQTLNREDIASMVYMEGHRVLVMGKDKRTIIQLSYRLASFEELLVAIETLGPLERKMGGQWKYQKAILEYVPVISLLVAFYIDQPLVKMIAGVLAAAGYGFKAYAMFRYNEGGKRLSLPILFRLLVFVVSLIMAWKGLQGLMG